MCAVRRTLSVSAFAYIIGEIMAHNQWDPTLYDQKHAFVFNYGRELLQLLAPQPGERILDLGCGTGRLTTAIAESGARVTGLDSSPEMIAAAARAYPHLEFVLGDARDFAFTHAFDAVFSNATLHWIPDCAPVAACVAAALKTGGRFIAEFGGKGNVARVVGALRQALEEHGQNVASEPWYNPSLGEFSLLLEQHRLEVRSAALFERMTELEESEQGLRNWIAMFRGGFFHNMEENLKQRIIARIEDLLRDELWRDGRWFVDYRRLRAVAYKLSSADV